MTGLTMLVGRIKVASLQPGEKSMSHYRDKASPADSRPRGFAFRLRIAHHAELLKGEAGTGHVRKGRG